MTATLSEGVAVHDFRHEDSLSVLDERQPPHGTGKYTT